MTSERRTLFKKTVPIMVIGLLIFFLYLYFLVGLDKIVLILETIDPFYYLLTFILAVLGMLVYSMVWQSLLNLLSIKIAFRKTFLFMWVGTFMDIIIPFETVSSEITRAYLASRSMRGNAGKVAASIVSHRIITMAVKIGRAHV